jgi:hypothetical protein
MKTFDAIAYPERNSERVARIGRLVSGEYVPRGPFDLYYGPLDDSARKDLPAFSYFERYYEK